MFNTSHRDVICYKELAGEVGSSAEAQEVLGSCDVVHNLEIFI